LSNISHLAGVKYVQCLLAVPHRYRRTTHVTPKSYLSFLLSYKTVYAQKKTELGELAERMNTGPSHFHFHFLVSSSSFNCAPACYWE